MACGLQPTSALGLVLGVWDTVGEKEAVSTAEELISRLVAETGHLEILTLIMPSTWSTAYKAQPVFAE